MKIAIALALGGLAAGCAVARESPPATSVCIRAMDIDRTETPDDSTILFYMRGHKVWKNTLTSPCFGLRMNTRGFTYRPIPGSNEICDNLQTIRVNETGAVCLLGAFSPVEPAPR
jgi:hypothetical protein